VQEVISKFNLDALRSQAGQTFRKRCTGCELIGIGGFNTVSSSNGYFPLNAYTYQCSSGPIFQVLILTFADGTDIVARLHGSRTSQNNDLGHSWHSGLRIGSDVS
jgi:hypothetical protein